MDSGIYKIENRVNGKVYIGSSKKIKHRFSGHKSDLRRNKHDNSHLQNSWNKYGESNFSFKPLIYCGEGGLGYYEELLIVDVFESHKRENGYNMKKGRKNSGMSKLAREKLSKSLKEYYENNENARKGVDVSEETKNKLREINEGNEHSEETKKKMSESHKGKEFTDEHRKNISESRQGIEFTEEHKRNLRKSHIGQEVSDETRDKLREAHKGEKSHRAELERSEVVEIKTLLKESDKLQKEIAEEYNVSETCISSIKNGDSWSHV